MAGAQLLGWAKSIAFLALLSLSTNSAQSRLMIPPIFPPNTFPLFPSPRALDTQSSTSPSMDLSALTRVHHVPKSGGVNMATALPPDFDRSFESHAWTTGGGGGGNAQISFGSPGIISAGGSGGATISIGGSSSGMIGNPNANAWGSGSGGSNPNMDSSYQSPIGIPAIPSMGGIFPPPLGLPTIPGMGEPFPPPLGLPTIPGMGEPFPPPLGLPTIPGMGEPFPPPLGLPTIPGMGEPFPPPLGLPTTPGMGELFPPHLGIPIVGYRVPIPLHGQYGAESRMGSTPETKDAAPAMTMSRAMAPTQA